MTYYPKVSKRVQAHRQRNKSHNDREAQANLSSIEYTIENKILSQRIPLLRRCNHQAIFDYISQNVHQRISHNRVELCLLDASVQARQLIHSLTSAHTHHTTPLAQVTLRLSQVTGASSIRSFPGEFCLAQEFGRARRRRILPKNSQDLTRRV